MVKPHCRRALRCLATSGSRSYPTLTFPREESGTFRLGAPSFVFLSDPIGLWPVAGQPHVGIRQGAHGGELINRGKPNRREATCQIEDKSNSKRQLEGLRFPSRQSLQVTFSQSVSGGLSRVGPPCTPDRSFPAAAGLGLVSRTQVGLPGFFSLWLFSFVFFPPKAPSTTSR